MGFNLLVFTRWISCVFTHILILAVTHHTSIPMGYSYFPKEAASFHRRYARLYFFALFMPVLTQCSTIAFLLFPYRWLKAVNLAFASEHTSGGHFAAYERPHN